MHSVCSLQALRVAAAAALLAACGGGGGGDDNSPTAPKSAVTSISVTPLAVHLVAGARQDLTATVAGTGSFDPSVTWSATAGSFTATGGATTSFIAPTTAGSWTITARSVQDPTKTATAVVNPVSPFAARLSRQDAYSATSGVTSYWTYTYFSSNALAKVENYSPTNSFIGVTNYTIDGAGHRSRTDSYNSSGALSAYMIVEYNDNYLPIRATTYSAAGVMTSRVESTFDAATRTKLSQNNYGSSNTLSSRYVFTYDAGNQRTTNTVYNAAGTLIGKTVYEFANGLMTKCTFYDANNVVTGWRIFTYEQLPTTEDLFAFGAW